MLLLLVPLALVTFRRGGFFAMLALLAVPPRPVSALEWLDLWLTPDQRAHRAFEAGDYSAAKGWFRDPLEGTAWVLQKLGGEAAPTGANGRPVDFQLLAEESRVGGFSGCNRYTGSYARDGVSGQGSPLSFGPLAGTMMACEDGGELEQRYLKALASVTAFRLDGGGLALLAGDDVVATFQPR